MKKMKQILLAMMAVSALVLAGCQDSEGATENESPSETETQDVLAQIKEKGELNVGIAPGYPPYEFYILDENGERQIAGSDTDLAKAIAEEIGVELVFTATDFNGVMANIQASSVDMGISGFNYTQERAKVMQFSEGYLQEQSTGFQGIMMQAEKAAEFSSLDDIKAAKLVFGAQGGSIQYELAGGLTDANKLKQYSTLDVGLAALNEGDIDGMVVSTSSAEPMLLTFTNLVILPKETFDLDPEQVYSTNVIAFPMGEEYESLIEVANKVIIENKENGTIEQWHADAIKLSRDAIDIE